MVVDAANWIAPAATMIAAIMTASNLGARVTGAGFVVFTIGALGWIAVAVATGQHNLLYSNAFLLVVDVIGIWRWLGRQARYDAAAGVASATSAATAEPTLFAVGTLQGCPVIDSGGDTIATVVEAMADCAAGNLAYLVVREGGVAGVAERLHAVGWHEVAVRDGELHTRLGRSDLIDRDLLDPAAWPASAREAGLA